MSEFDLVSDLVDVSGLNMDQLDVLPDTALTRVLREVLHRTEEPVAAFSSALV
jgi:FXSXX-COOH protein